MMKKALWCISLFIVDFIKLENVNYLFKPKHNTLTINESRMFVYGLLAGRLARSPGI